ncbi:uncharacterized protein BDZ99DRAFT_575330 [Mytilinidion resinicola]|uniref:Uncharacterized protein n=1 Tax=Mytilinidion resinicola TaxID=574789 RepID=A0A6A6Y820_9PEZI|nr:uncharacterized protein BDZ99DRAFT_575330 [Mytilinidion resinicola]KAF2804693.1 hypothetical protein BDZ99DRAFT_575330 [Mytilinidion resinicola]
MAAGLRLTETGEANGSGKKSSASSSDAFTSPRHNQQALTDRRDNGLPHRGNPAPCQHVGCFWNVHAAALCKVQGSSTTEIHREMRHAAHQARESVAGATNIFPPRLATRFGALGREPCCSAGVWDAPAQHHKPSATSPPASIFDAAKESGGLRCVVAARISRTRIAPTAAAHVWVTLRSELITPPRRR